MKFILIALVCFPLCACQTTSGYTAFKLIPRSGNSSASGVAYSKGKKVDINIDGEHYYGTYIHDGDKSVRSSGYNVSNASTSFGTSYIPGSGNGKLIATSGKNSIRCDFNYQDGSGVGFCEDNSGKVYDMLIN